MTIKGSCHCGTTKFEVPDAPQVLLRCNCSYCSKLGVLRAYYLPEQFKLTAAPQRQATYLWGPKAIRHHFCGTCGCTTFAESTNWETGKPHIGLNALLFDDFEIATIPIEDVDGKTPW